MSGFVIVVANPKGGVGKTTTALLLASFFDHYHLRVTVFDADRQRSLYGWKSKGVTRSTFDVIAASEDKALYTGIQQAIETRDIIIVDVAGVKDFLFLRALALADHVIVPLQTSPLDAERAAETCELIEEQAELLKTSVPYSLLYTKTKVAMRTKLQVDLDKRLQGAVPTLKPDLAEREAYKHMFLTGQTIYELDEKKISNHQKALENAELLGVAVLRQTKIEVAPEHRTWVFSAEPSPFTSSSKVA